MKKHIFLTGFMGSGKTTLGKRLAKKLKRPFIDSDSKIEKYYNKSINQIFREEGEKWFRKIEKEQINDICNSNNPAVISLGGGALMSKKNLEKVLSSGILIYIKISPEEVYKRIYQKTNRPLMQQNGKNLSKRDYLKKINELLRKREEGYNAAHIVLNNDHFKVDQALDILISKLI